ncbi:hypothetical protein SLEP1_g49223 [Rubroshorea leprosula]|uniref:Reverse transcriptase domain-containing protein n=1 Tax=Rubroshorea leprosula TaxID=152421 RepID=A0AAV5LWA4_9ROSI|nr:hypothetical protein SLEP1_g49223 [Rubroshorea leprosula]
MSFDDTWCRWIMECLSSSMISVLINGSPSRQFPVSKGLWQGDPLSLLLFLIVVEGLNGLISKAVEEGLYEGLKVSERNLTLTHLQFAYDNLIFGKATDNNVWAAKCILRAFELVSKRKINYNKSQIMGVHTNDEWFMKMAWLLNCKVGSLPFKYLRIPVGGNPRKLSFWHDLVESFKRKLSSWKSHHLSFGERITLLNSVLSSMSVFLMSFYSLPKGKDYSIKQMISWLNGAWEWSLSWRRNLLAKEALQVDNLLSVLHQVPLHWGKKDEWRWLYSANERYEVRLSYHMLLNSDPTVTQEIYDQVWLKGSLGESRSGSLGEPGLGSSRRTHQEPNLGSPRRTQVWVLGEPRSSSPGEPRSRFSKNPVTATILDLKLQIKTFLGHPVHTQDLFLRQKLPEPWLLELEDGTIVRNVVCGDDKTLFLKVKFSVWVRTGFASADWFELIVYTDDTMLTMKTMLQQQYGIPVEDMSLAIVDPTTDEFVVLDDRAEIRSINIPLRAGIDFHLV